MTAVVCTPDMKVHTHVLEDAAWTHTHMKVPIEQIRSKWKDGDQTGGKDPSFWSARPQDILARLLGYYISIDTWGFTGSYIPRPEQLLAGYSVVHTEHTHVLAHVHCMYNLAGVFTYPVIIVYTIHNWGMAYGHTAYATTHVYL